MNEVYHMDSDNANKQAKTEINMNKNNREGMLQSMEIMAEEAVSVTNWDTVAFILSNYGAKAIDDIPDSRLSDVLNDLQLLAEGDLF